MSVMRVWHMGMRMAQSCVPMQVAVRAGVHRRVHVVVVAIVVAVRVFVFHRLVLVFVAV